MKLPEKLPGHFATKEGREILERYMDRERDKLAGGHLTDTEAAHTVAMLMRDQLNHEGVLAIGRDRIRWLSAQLAVRDSELAEARASLKRATALLERACDHLEGWTKIARSMAAAMGAENDPALAFLGVPLETLLGVWEAADDPGPEGWGLFESETYGWEIERDDDAMEPLADDEAALAHVRTKAADGSQMHQLALAIHLTQEAKNKAAAQAAGYDVEPDGFAGGWIVRDPEGEEVEVTCATEICAWSAAYRDLMERPE